MYIIHLITQHQCERTTWFPLLLFPFSFRKNYCLRPERSRSIVCFFRNKNKPRVRVFDLTDKHHFHSNLTAHPSLRLLDRSSFSLFFFFLLLPFCFSNFFLLIHLFISISRRLLLSEEWLRRSPSSPTRGTVWFVFQKLLITCCRHCYRRPAWRRENSVSFFLFFLVYLIAYLFPTEPKNPN